MAAKRTYDVTVAGGGAAGLTAALLMARAGLDTALLAPGPTGRDPRTSALMMGAIRLLQNVGAWEALEASCAPLQRLRLVDDTDWMAKAPTVEFDAGEIGPDPFAFNVPNADLVEVLGGLCERTLVRLDTQARMVTPGRDMVEVETTDGTALACTLLVGADGRTSLCRDAAGIVTNSWSYPQAALACCFEHEDDHAFTSTEFHRAAGPLTLVPMPGRRSSLVWVETPERARELAAMPADRFEALLTACTNELLGRISNATPRAVFDLAGLAARSFAARRVALVGEAAHVLPPIGAQGLNLGLRDAATIAELVEDAQAGGRGIAGAGLLAEYDRRRRRDVLPRTAIVDILNRSLFSGTMVLQGLRGAGLHMLDRIGPLRRQFMRHGMQPSGELPRIMH
jgi:2-octaprenyl-6-methoxyphenol hydroxylase